MESLSHAGFAGDFGGFIHFEVSGGLDEPDGHCHALVDGVVVGAGVVAVVGVDVVVGDLQFGLLELLGVVVEFFLGFSATFLGQLNFNPVGILALYLGGVDVAGVVGVLRSEGLFATLL